MIRETVCEVWTADYIVLKRIETGWSFLYNFLTAFVTAGIFIFIAIYSTGFISVVTLGGTVLGSALIGFFSAMLTFILRNILRIRLLRYATEIVGCSCIIAGTVRGLPGWELHFSVGTVFFLLLLCIAATVISEFTMD